MTHKEKILKGVIEQDKVIVQEGMRLMFEEKLERKIWKIYKSIEKDLDLKKDEK